MAQVVTIDIPGIGNVEAKNAASEATLFEILKIMKKFDKETNGGKDLGDGGGKSEKDGGGSAGGKLGKVGEAAGAVAKKMAFVVGVLNGFSGALTKTISEFANVGDSLESAAGALSFIPILGPMFGAVASAAEKTTSAFQSAAAAGASFNGSVNEFSRTASAAGMTMADFGNLVKSNGEGMLGLGGTVEEGAKRFGQISKAIRTTSNDLYALGFSTKDINQGLANYTGLLRQQGLQGSKTNSQLADGARKYMKEMDALARITGEERSAKEAQAKALANDAKFQAAMAGMNEDVRSSFRDTVLGLPGPLQDFTKDMLANGVATTEENQKLMAMMPQSAAMLQQMQAKMQRGEAVSMAERNALNNMMKAEGAKNLQSIKSAGAASSELSGVVNGLAATMQINENAVAQTAEEQEEARKKTDALNAAVEKNKQALAGLSNSFQMALANSGLLPIMMKAFEFVADVVMKYMVPAFNIIGAVVGGVASLLIDILSPAFSLVATIIGDYIYPALRYFAAFVITDLMPPIMSMAETVGNWLSPAFNWLGELVTNYVVPAFQGLTSFIQEYAVPVFYGLIGGAAAYLGVLAWQNAAAIGQALATGWNTVVTWAQAAATGVATAATWLMSGGLMAAAAGLAAFLGPILLIVAPIAALVALFVGLYRSGWTFWTAIDAVKDNLQRFWLTLMDSINTLLSYIPNAIGGISEEEAERRKAANDEIRAQLDEKERLRDVERDQVKKERGIEEQDNKRKQAAAGIDQKLLGIKGEQLAQAKQETEIKKDYNDSLALLKAEGKQQGSAWIKDGSKSATPAAESARGAVTNQPENKESGKDGAKSGTGTTQKAPTTQESPETLLASLNNKMDQLIKLNSKIGEINERQLTVQQSLSNDLFASV
jgi:hypothetical protein